MRPHIALFGEKDYQQLRGPNRADGARSNFDIEIVPVPIVREPDGLAMSSRNAYLSPDHREKALVLSEALRAAEAAFRTGARDPQELVQAARRSLEKTPEVQVEYVEAVDASTLENVECIDRPVVVALAARLGTTRLIDNMVFTP